jgi:hypothetical protein
MSLTKTRRLSSSRNSITSTGRRLTNILLKNSFSFASARTSSIGSTTTPRTGSILSDFNVLGEHDYEMTRQIMRDLIEEIQIEKPFISFDEIFLDQDDIIGCLLRIFYEYAEDIHGIKRITRENMLKLLENSEIFNEEYTSVIFIDDWNNLRQQMIKNKIYERKTKSFDFCGFIQLIDVLKNRLHKSKDEIFKRIIGSQIYNDVIKLKEIRDKSQLGVLPSMNTLIDLYNDVRNLYSIVIGDDRYLSDS